MTASVAVTLKAYRTALTAHAEAALKHAQYPHSGAFNQRYEASKKELSRCQGAFEYEVEMVRLREVKM